MADDNINLREDAAAGDGEEDLLKYLRSILNHKWIILTIVGAVFTLSALHFYKLPDYYTATSRVMIHKVDNTTISTYSELSAPQSYDITYFETQVEILRGMPVCKRVAQNLDLKQHYGVSTDAQAAAMLRNFISSALIRNTRILTVSATDRAPEWTAKIANELVDAYIQEALKDRMFVNEQILKWFPDDVKSSATDATPMDLLKKIDDKEMAEKLPSVVNDPNIRQMKQEKTAIEANIRELLTRYTPEHPKVKELNGRLEYLEGEIHLQIEKITSSLKAALTGEFNVSNVKVLERAVVPGAPSGPNRQRGVATMTIIGLVIGIGIAIFLDSIDKTIKTDEDILGVNGLPFLGNVPIIDANNRRGAKGAAVKFGLEDLVNNGTVSDAMTSLNTALLFSMPKGQNKHIMVTSSIPGEGKTTVSYLLALSMAKMGSKVLLVELDLRRPSLAQKMKGAVAKMKGIADYLVGQATYEEILYKPEGAANLDVIFAGGSSPNPTTLFTSNVFDEFLKSVEQKYDRIVFDSPPSLQIPDPIILSNKMHGVIFVIGSGMIHKKIALKTIRKFTFVGSTIFGAVINRINYKKSGLGAYNYYYGKYYGKNGKNAS